MTYATVAVAKNSRNATGLESSAVFRWWLEKSGLPPSGCGRTTTAEVFRLTGKEFVQIATGCGLDLVVDQTPGSAEFVMRFPLCMPGLRTRSVAKAM
jgi:hypothetical protein